MPEAQVDEYVLVHVGFALTAIDENEAVQVFEHLREMGELLDADAGRAPGGFARNFVTNTAIPPRRTALPRPSPAT